MNKVVHLMLMAALMLLTISQAPAFFYERPAGSVLSERISGDIIGAENANDLFSHPHSEIELNAVNVGFASQQTVEKDTLPWFYRLSSICNGTACLRNKNTFPACIRYSNYLLLIYPFHHFW